MDLSCLAGPRFFHPARRQAADLQHRSLRREGQVFQASFPSLPQNRHMSQIPIKRFLPAGSTRSSFSRRFAHKALCRTKVLLTVTEFGDINSFRDSWGRIPGVILRIEAMPVCDGSRIDDKKFSS